MNNSAAALSYYAVIKSQFIANLGLCLTMIIVVSVLIYKKKFNVFEEYFGINSDRHACSSILPASK
ncbi:MAG: hypothetical protein OEX02_11705 [Cyclobacteriaceae bacterium]|nr:hypothetical protein [Cyclobacteriaceae bacterium]